MKKLMILFIVLLGTIACKPGVDDHPNCYVNEDVILVKKGIRDGAGAFFVIKRITDETQVAELNSDNWYGLNILCGCNSKEAYALYNKRAEGDTLHFKYIAKNRFNSSTK